MKAAQRYLILEPFFAMTGPRLQLFSAANFGRELTRI